MPKIIHKELSYTVRGVLFDVFNQLGPMLSEHLYRDAIVHGLTLRGIQCEPEKQFQVAYRSVQVGLYLVDVWIENGKIILEIKVAPHILPLHKAQAISYLKVTGADLAIVVSYGASSLLDERLPNFLRDKTVAFQWDQRPLPDGWLHPELSNQVLEALHRVHFKLGPGFLHQVYRRATMVELRYRELPFDYIKRIPITYAGQNLGEQDVRLIKVDNRILLATVAVKRVDRAMREQFKARLRHLNLKLGFIANFHSTTLQAVPVRI